MPLEIRESPNEGIDIIERILFYDSDPIASVFIEPSLTEYTLSWYLHEETNFSHLLPMCLEEGGVVPAYNPEQEPLKIEFWLDDQFFEESSSSINICEYILEKIYRPNDNLNLLQISCDKLVVEIIFDETTPKPHRIALLFSEIRHIEIYELFRAFHKNAHVRTNPDLWIQALNNGFLQSSRIEGGVQNDILEESSGHASMHRGRTSEFTTRQRHSDGES